MVINLAVLMVCFNLGINVIVFVVTITNNLIQIKVDCLSKYFILENSMVLKISITTIKLNGIISINCS